MKAHKLEYPTKLRYGRRSFQQAFREGSHRGDPDPSRHFSLVLPRCWGQVDATIETPDRDGSLRPLALFRTREEPRAEVAVSVACFDRDVSPGDWLDILHDSIQEEVVARRDKNIATGRVPDVLTRRRQNGRTTISRWLAIKDGPRMFLLQARTAERDYAEFADVFYTAVASFRLLNPGTWPFAERLRTFSRAVPDDFLMFYPESWERTEQEGNDADELTLHLDNQVDGVSVGRITFAVIRHSEPLNEQMLFMRYRETLADAGVQIPDRALEPAAPGGAFEQAWSAVCEGRRLGAALELRIIIGRRTGAWFIAALCGPARELDPCLWAINTRALAIVTENLRTIPTEQREESPARCGCNHG